MQTLSSFNCNKFGATLILFLLLSLVLVSLPMSVNGLVLNWPQLRALRMHSDKTLCGFQLLQKQSLTAITSCNSSLNRKPNKSLSSRLSKETSLALVSVLVILSTISMESIVVVLLILMAAIKASDLNSQIGLNSSTLFPSLLLSSLWSMSLLLSLTAALVISLSSTQRQSV